MPVTLDLTDDGPLKRDLIELAFGDLGIRGYEFSLTPEMVSDALRRLNALMREWPYSEIGYEQPEYGVGEPADASGVPFEHMNGVAAALAQRLAPLMGATLTPEASANLATSLSILRAQYATIPTMPYARSTPRGAGHRMQSAGPFIEETAEDVNPVEEA